MMNYLRLFGQAAKMWNRHEMGHHAAAFAYYAPFALIPLILLSVGISGYFFGIDFVRNIFLSWGTVFGSDIVALINIATQNLDIQVHTYDVPALATVLFLGITILAFNVLGSGFTRIWGEGNNNFLGLLKQSGRSIMFVIILQVYFIFMIILEGFWAELAVRDLTIFPSLVWFLSISLFFFLLFRFLVAKGPGFKGCLIGGLTTGVLFIFAKNLVGVYLAAKPVLTIFGAAGLILVLLVWVYVLAAIIYYGASVAYLVDQNSKNASV
jgi:membrane protein